MPNWCDNRVAIQGPPKLVMEVVERLESDERWFDFEGYLPTPPELLDPDQPREEHTLPDWYEWRREHWGVKWNARGSTRRGYGRTGRVRYRFLTAWGPPDTFLDHLAACHPELTAVRDRLMWLLTTQGFYSVVEDRGSPDHVLVRARAREDLEALQVQVPDLSIWEDSAADYRFRARLSRVEWIQAVAQMAAAVDYDNFKNAVRDRQGSARAQLYSTVWAALRALQHPS